MGNSAVNSPNSTFETEDTIKLNTSIISSSSNSNGNNNFNFGDQIYQFDNVNTPFNPLPPPPISINTPYQYKSSSTPSSNHFSNPDVFQQNDFSLPNLSHYSIFSNQNAMNSVNSLHNEGHQGHIFKLNMDSNSDIMNDYSISNSQNSDLMYNITEFELANSLESIPDSNAQLNHSASAICPITDHAQHPTSQSLDSSHISQHSHHIPNTLNHHPSDLHFNDSLHNISTHDVIQYPYTPTISDIYTPTLSETSSFTPNSSVNNVTNNTTFLSEDYNIRAPIPVLVQSHSFSNTTPTSNKISKKPSMSRLNASLNKKSSIITSQLHASTNNTPLSEPSPQMPGVSPLCHKYKDMEVYNQPSPIGTRSFSNCSTSSTTSITTPNKSLMPPLNTFRHNSDSSSCSSYYSETPKRKNYQKSGKTYPTNYPTLSDISTKKSTSRKTSKGAIVAGDDSDKEILSSTKQKKHTRRRLLPRSKNGCWICRIKHLKCDEIRPVCTSCSKFGIECDYSPVKPGYVLDKNLRKEKLMDISILRKQKHPVSKIQTGSKDKNGDLSQQYLDHDYSFRS